ncbi:MAG: ABC transporter permease [Acetobacteraceae bacterium]|nr:ABC transporter permease [Acetobacteraceae bacterium]
MLDLRNRYRGSVLGPLWTTLSAAATVAGLGILYSALFRLPAADYVPHLAVSLILWQAIAAFLQDACLALSGSAAVIRQVPMPVSLHVLRCLFRNLLAAAHSLPLIPVVFAVFGTWPGPEAAAMLPGLLLLVLAGFSAALALGLLCARFRDIPPIVANLTQLAFFLTPVLWTPELLPPEALPWLPLNPFHALLETVRAPLLSGGADAPVWAAAIGWTALLAAAAGALFVRFRARVPYWV